MAIPNWDPVSRVIPPILEVVAENQTVIENRSPYRTTLTEVVKHFAITPERVHLLTGLINYRQALYDAGVRRGFQWLNGSFVELVEADEERPNRSPNDIDVVTFFYPPVGAPPEKGPLFDPEFTRRTYSIDAYAVTLGHPLDQNLVASIAHWHGMWSLTKNGKRPKGFVEIELDPENDQHAWEALNAETP